MEVLEKYFFNHKLIVILKSDALKGNFKMCNPKVFHF